MDPANRVKTYNYHQNHMFAFFDGTRLRTPKIDHNTSKHGAEKQPKCRKTRPQKSQFFFTLIMASFWYRMCPKTDPKMNPKSSQMAPLGAQGAAWGNDGIPKTSLCRFGAHFGAQNDPKMANIHPNINKMPPKMTPKIHGRLTFCDNVV